MDEEMGYTPNPDPQLPQDEAIEGETPHKKRRKSALGLEIFKEKEKAKEVTRSAMEDDDDDAQSEFIDYSMQGDESEHRYYTDEDNGPVHANLDDLEINWNQINVDDDLDAEFVSPEEVAKAQAAGKQEASLLKTKSKKQEVEDSWLQVPGAIPNLYEDYTEPFAANHTQMQEMITSAYQVLARAWGRKGNPHKVKAIKLATDHVLGANQAKIIMISPVNPWVIINLETVEQRAKLLNRIIILNRSLKTAIFYRPFLRTPSLRRMVQVLRVPPGEETLNAVEMAAMRRWPDAHTAARRRQPIQEVEQSHVYVKLHFKELEQAKAFVNRGQLEVKLKDKVFYWEIQKAPTCQFCGGNDHIDIHCRWIDVAKALQCPLNPAMGEKGGREGPKGPPRKERIPKSYAKVTGESSAAPPVTTDNPVASTSTNPATAETPKDTLPPKPRKKKKRSGKETDIEVAKEK